MSLIAHVAIDGDDDRLHCRGSEPMTRSVAPGSSDSVANLDVAEARELRDLTGDD